MHACMHEDHCGARVGQPAAGAYSAACDASAGALDASYAGHAYGALERSEASAADAASAGGETDETNGATTAAVDYDVFDDRSDVDAESVDGAAAAVGEKRKGAEVLLLSEEPEPHRVARIA